MAILLLVGVIVAVDRVTKEIAVRKLAWRRHGVLRVVANARPLLTRGASSRELVVLWVIGGTCATAALICAPALRENTLLTAGVAAALAGAAGNLVDRLVRGGVVDFIAIGRWPVFNVADVAIVGGTALAGASLL